MRDKQADYGAPSFAFGFPTSLFELRGTGRTGRQEKEGTGPLE